MEHKEIKALLALNTEQKVLLEEWNNLKVRMNNAKIVIIQGDCDQGFAAVNGEKIIDYNCDGLEKPRAGMVEIEKDGKLWNCNIPFGNFDVPNFIRLCAERFYILFN